MTAAAEPSDIELVEHVIAGKAGAFEAFYRRYGRLIQDGVRKRLAGTYASGQVEDVVGDFFVKLVRDQYRLLQAWQRGSSLRIFLSVVVRNHAVDHLKKNTRSNELRRDVELADWFDPDQLWAETPAHGLGVRQLRRAVATACHRLTPPRSRLLLRLKLVRQMANDDIARRVQMTEGAARTAISRAKSDLLTELRRLVPEYFSDAV